MLTVLIDESGTLPDLQDKYIVVSGVEMDNTEKAERLISRVLESLRQTRESLKLKELKFHRTRYAVRRIFLSAIAAANINIFILAVDKKNRKIADTPENFAAIISELVGEIGFWYKARILSLIIDKHFHKKSDEEQFNVFLKRYLRGNFGIEATIIHLDSKTNLIVNIADIVAGAVFWKYRGKGGEFFRIIKDNIVIEKITNWPELKKKVIARENEG